MNLLYKGYGIVRLLRAINNLQKHPDNTEYVFDISDACNRLNLYGLSKDLLFAKPENQVSLQEMWLLPELDLQMLREKPEGSFGNAYAKHMLSHGFKPDFWRKSEIHNDITYVTVRMRQTHDLWHVMTGFDVDVEGEIGLQAFVLAQTGLPIAIILLVGAMLRAIFKDIKSLPKLMDAVAHGWRMGKKAKSIFPTRWEEIWDQSLLSMQQQYGIDLKA